MEYSEKGISVPQAVFLHAKEKPEELCLCDVRQKLSWRMFRERIARLAVYLSEQGVRPGDHVLIRNTQNADFMTAVLAVQTTGAVSIPLEKNILPRRMEEIAVQAEADYVIAVKDPGIGIPYIPVTAYQEEEADADTCIHTVEEMLSRLSQADIAEILYTTGTTGASKGIVLTHGSITAVCENVIDGVQMEQGNTELIPVPLSHSHGLRRTYSNLLYGGCVVLLDGVVFIRNFFDSLDTDHVTAVDLVPAALSALLSLSGDRLGEYRDQIRYVQLGSAPIPAKDREKLCALLPESRLYNFYGSTEAGCSCIIDFNHEKMDGGCIGRPVGHAEFAFFDENGCMTEGTKEKPGFLGCRGAMNMEGYYRESGLTEQILRDGYIISQDLAYMDEEGRICLVGRSGDVIVSGGNKISPSEVEDAAGRIRGVKDCACVPAEDPSLGQVPKLYFVREPGSSITGQEIYDQLRERLENYKVPRLYEEITKIPRTYNGKILRRELKQNMPQ